MLMSQLLNRIPTLVFAIGVMGSAFPTCANVKVAGMFGDHMVLQQDQKVPVWGTADAGEKVTGSAGGHAGATGAAADGKWRGGLASFSGRQLRSKLNRPVGLIGCSLGGTDAQAWTSISGLQKDPPFSRYIEAHQKWVEAYPTKRPGYEERKAQFEQALKEWNAKYD